MTTDATPTFYCNFCGKSQHEVAKIIAGPKDIHICNECVYMCVGILVEAIPSEDAKAKGA